jgi:ribosomal protein S27AE
MLNKVSNHLYTISKQDQASALSTKHQSCPKCTNNMQFLADPKTVKHEFYCITCHVSIPLFPGRENS